jgi:ParB family chromosome partitioning protein
VPVGAISPNTFQPRSRFVDEELESLASSIRELGVLQPVLLRYIDVDRYELVAGERRWRAAVRAGLASIPAIVRPADDRTSLEQAVVENLHRADLNPLEEAAAYRQLMDEFGMTQDSVARRVGKSRSAVANLLRLFQLPSSVQRLIASESLGAGHARALLAFPDPRVQEELAERVVQEGLSVRKVEELVRAASLRSAERREGGTEEAAAPSAKGPAVLAIEELLSDHLDTRVEVARSGDRGRITVEFADAEDLDRLAELLLGRTRLDD